jgi:hypothetical protein
LDFAFFADRWFLTGCGLLNNCNGADLDLSGTVDSGDLEIFTDSWQRTIGDFDNDGDVDFFDFAKMSLKWMQTDRSFYCGGVDLTGDGWVDWKDLSEFSDNWLKE